MPIGGVGGALLLAVLIMAAFCLALRRPLAATLGVDGPAFTSIFQAATRWQTFVALAVANNLYGDAGVALASVAMVAMIPVLNVMTVCGAGALRAAAAAGLAAIAAGDRARTR